MPRRKRKLQRLSDVEFNDRLRSFLDITIKSFSEDPADDYLEMVVEVRGDVENIVGLVPDDNQAVNDWEQFCRDYGRHSPRAEHKVAPQAILYFFLSTQSDGSEAIVIHGATNDGRQNVAALEVSRDAKGQLVPGESQFFPHPCEAEALPVINYAKLIIEGFGG